MTTHDRYHISDPICGLVCTRTSLTKALESARAHKCEEVTVFDAMARFDNAQLWDPSGKVLAFRHRTAGGAA